MIHELEHARRLVPELQHRITLLKCDLSRVITEAAEAKVRLERRIGVLTEERDGALLRAQAAEERCKASVYLSQIRTVLEAAEADDDEDLATLGRQAVDALDALEALQDAIGQRLEVFMEAKHA